VLEIGVTQEISLIHSLSENISYVGLAASHTDISKLGIQHRRKKRALFIENCAFTQPTPYSNCVVINIDFSMTDIPDIWSILENLYHSSAKYLVFAHTNAKPTVLKQSPFNFPDELLSCKSDETSYSMWLTKDIKSFLQPCNSTTSQLRQRIVQIIDIYLNPLEQLFDNDLESYFQLLHLLHSEMKSEKARSFYDNWIQKHSRGAAAARESLALKDLVRLRFWSNEARLLAEFNFLDKTDKDKIIAISSEHLRNQSTQIL